MVNDMLLFAVGSVGRIARKIGDKNVRAIGLTSAQLRILFFLEEKDNGGNLHLLALSCDAKTRTEPFSIEGEQFPAILADGWREKQQPDAENSLYCEAAPVEYETVELKFVPYYTWANRGENEMTVWVHRKTC